MAHEPMAIDHIAFLVPDLDAAILRWSAITGREFGPIVRYRTERFFACDADLPVDGDARLTVSREAGPRIELIEVRGDGMYGPDQVGLHHIGFRASSEEVGAQIERLASHGIGTEAHITDDAGELLTWFGGKGQLDGIRLEYITPLPAPLVLDDGSPIPIDPATGRPDPLRGSGK